MTQLLSPAAVARRIGCARWSVVRRAREIGLKPQVGNRWAFTERQVQKLAAVILPNRGQPKKTRKFSGDASSDAASICVDSDAARSE